MPAHVDYEIKISITKCNKFVITIPRPLLEKKRLEPLTAKAKAAGARVVALDPGVRTKHTLYDASGCVIKWGTQSHFLLGRLCHALDSLQSRMTSPFCPIAQWRKMKNAGARIRERIRNLVRDCNAKLIRYLCDRYEVILLPSFEVSKMARKSHRRIGSKTARSMLTWKHYEFKQKLISKAMQYENCQVLIVNEAYTSKTCGNCGNIAENLGGAETYKCKNCNLVIDRDMNGARNIMLRFYANYSHV